MRTVILVLGLLLFPSFTAQADPAISEDEAHAIGAVGAAAATTPYYGPPACGYYPYPPCY